MNRLQWMSAIAALGLACAAQAQNETQPAGSQQTEPESQQTMPGQQTSPEQQPSGTQTQPSPAPSTSPTEGTAADRTPPGETPTRDIPESAMPPSPAPSTSPAEGTAADTTPPGETSTQVGTQQQEQATTRMAAASGTMMKHRASQIIGTNVQTSEGDAIGEVKDVIVDKNGQVTHAVISHGGTMGVGAKLTAVPWSVVGSMMQGDRLVMDQASLERAPSFSDGEWPNMTTSTWSSDADSYWATKGAGSSSYEENREAPR